ncbi:LysE family translocator [Ralstonia mannitolilytica]|uniref:Leucine efflux protein n=1 Tax=Ralstonia mannitolilytica TaxID=105219 RepID=A0AAD2AV92_9RALS|nr:LysE family translocator [Ralstonia mannitolilytica]ATG18597.1 LysE family translocator [Ralstonia pickettii]ANA33266.1 hypothetical protein VZ52_07510 [Ralstonia mannitolilytica]MBY4720793.1 LysE family translocator [Ralstonia mannitolilytica]CAJ0681345.1 Leucine efflux protein [Ralstonia mannitolilytica]CAJ0691982.1 Leucine efflux protein [Ralstonia mannitolilytica]
MIDLAVLPYFLLTVALVVAIPGPNTIYVSTTSVNQGFKFGLASCAGIMLGTLVHVSFAALGLTALLLASPVLFAIVKYLGAFYLVYLGLKSITAKASADGGVQPQASMALTASIKKGFLVNLLNPKTGLFIAAFLPQFVDPSAGHTSLQIFSLGVVLIVVGGLSDIAYAAAASKIGKVVANRGRKTRIGKFATGVVYMGLGVAAMVTSDGTAK